MPDIQATNVSKKVTLNFDKSNVLLFKSNTLLWVKLRVTLGKVTRYFLARLIS